MMVSQHTITFRDQKKHADAAHVMRRPCSFFPEYSANMRHYQTMRPTLGPNPKP